MEHLWSYSSIILALVLFAKLLATKTKTVDVLWLIVLGSLAANIGLLPQENDILEAIGDWGIVFVMFALGFEENIANFTAGLKRSWGIAIIGALFPFAAGYYTAALFGFGFNVSMIWGLTMTATAVSLTMVSLKAEQLHTTPAATGIMTAAVVDDILSLVGLAILIPIALAGSDEAIDMGTIAYVLLKVVMFFAIILFIGIVLFPDSLHNEKGKKHGRFFNAAITVRYLFGIRKLLTAYRGHFTPLVMIFVAMLFGAIAHFFGFHPAVGAYFAGLFLKEEYFLCTVDNTLADHKRDAELVINHLAFTIFGPIFFVMLGTKLVFEYSLLIEILPMALLLFFAVLILQVFSAGLAARLTGNYRWHESVMIGLGMLGRAELAFIVIDLAYVENKLITTGQFYALMITIFLLNITVPLAIKWWKPYYLGTKRLRLGTIELSRPSSSET
jgi:Kef-type K+ transport system membrane component KefB